VGLYDQFGPLRVRDTPISEQAILGAAMGAAMTGLKPIAEIMFSDFIAVCFDYFANEFPKSRYMTAGQAKCPLVVRTANGGGARFGAQHSQSVENWCMMIPGLKVVAPSTPFDVVGLMAAAVRDPDPVIFFEHKTLYSTKGEVPDGEIVDTLGTARIVRPGKDWIEQRLARLAHLRDSGVVSPDEYEAQRQRILDSVQQRAFRGLTGRPPSYRKPRRRHSPRPRPLPLESCPGARRCARG